MVSWPHPLPGQQAGAGPDDMGMGELAGWPTQLPPRSRTLSWPIPTSPPLRAAGAREGTGPADPQLQDLHSSGNNRMRIQYWWCSRSQGPWTKAMTLRWIFSSEAVWTKEYTVWHTDTPQLPQWDFCFVFFGEEERLQRQRADMKGLHEDLIKSLKLKKKCNSNSRCGGINF